MQGISKMNNISEINIRFKRNAISLPLKSLWNIIFIEFEDGAQRGVVSIE